MKGIFDRTTGKLLWQVEDTRGREIIPDPYIKRLVEDGHKKEDLIAKRIDPPKNTIAISLAESQEVMYTLRPEAEVKAERAEELKSGIISLRSRLDAAEKEGFADEADRISKELVGMRNKLAELYRS